MYEYVQSQLNIDKEIRDRVYIHIAEIARNPAKKEECAKKIIFEINIIQQLIIDKIQYFQANDHENNDMITGDYLQFVSRHKRCVIKIFVHKMNLNLSVRSHSTIEYQSFMLDEEYQSIKITKRKDNKKACVICIRNFTKETGLRKLPCHHVFHDGCLKPWLENNVECPTCRDNIIKGFIQNENMKEETNKIIKQMNDHETNSNLYTKNINKKREKLERIREAIKKINKNKKSDYTQKKEKIQKVKKKIEKIETSLNKINIIKIADGFLNF